MRRKFLEKNKYEHFNKRLKERYKMSVTLSEWRELGKLVRQGESEFLESKTNTRVAHKILLNEVEVFVIYDKNAGVLVSALPQNCKESED